jgi:hypothetical protein
MEHIRHRKDERSVQGPSRPLSCRCVCIHIYPLARPFPIPGPKGLAPPLSMHASTFEHAPTAASPRSRTPKASHSTHKRGRQADQRTPLAHPPRPLRPRTRPATEQQRGQLNLHLRLKTPRPTPAHTSDMACNTQRGMDSRRPRTPLVLPASLYPQAPRPPPYSWSFSQKLALRTPTASRRRTDWA